MRTIGLGEANLGAVAGAVVAGIGGLFAIGVPCAIIDHDLKILFQTPTLSLLCWLLSMPSGWLLGGQIGPRIGEPRNSPRAELIVGGCCGLVPVLLVATWGWYLALQP